MRKVRLIVFLGLALVVDGLVFALLGLCALLIRASGREER